MMRFLNILLKTSSRFLYLGLIVFSAFFNQAWADLNFNSAKTVMLQNPATDTMARPKIGLVLAGGGARGLAHIGVIKGLEKMHIPIDFISGTSMGALIGGLYASGMSIAQIESFATNVDWEMLFNDNASRNYLSFRRKQDEYDFLFRADVGMHNWQILFPSGLLQGQQQYNLLESLTLNIPNRYLAQSNFDFLPIPFRAVATDIETGKAMVLGHGNLAKALRASMSVPGVYAPVEIDGHLLVDGGLANNTPIDVARQMGADIIIVVDIHSPQYKREDLKGLIEISDQIISNITTNNTLNQLAHLNPTDVCIEPKLDYISASNFADPKTIIERGLQATLDSAKKLAPLSMMPSSNYDVKDLLPSLLVSEINLDNQTQLSDRMIREHISQRPEQPLDQVKLETDLAFLYGMGFFQRLNYEIQPIDESHNRLIIHAIPPSWGPNFFKLKFNLASNFYDSNIFNLGLRHTYLPANSMGAEWRNEFQIGDYIRYATEYYQPINDKHTLYLNAFYRYQDHVYDLLNSSSPSLIRLQQKTSTPGLGFGINISPNLNLASHLYLESGDLTFGAQTSQQTRRNYEDAILSVQLKYDTLNQVSFPDYGRRLSLQALTSRQNLSEQSKSEEWGLEFSQFYSQGRHTLNAYVEYRDMNTTDNTNIHRFYTLGGFQKLSGFSQDALFGDRIAFGRVKYLYRISGSSSRQFNFPFYAGATLEAGNAYNNNASNHKERNIAWQNTLQSGSLFIGLNSLVGPIYLAYGYHNSQQQSFYLYFGKDFY